MPFLTPTMRGGVRKSILMPYNAGTPLARISHRELIDKLYASLTAFLQLRYELSVQWRSEGPRRPRDRGWPARLKEPARGPSGKSSRRNPLARGPYKLFAGGPKIVSGSKLRE